MKSKKILGGFLIFCFLLFSVHGESAAGPYGVNKDGNPSSKSEKSAIDFAAECEKKFKIKALEGRVEEMEQKINQNKGDALSISRLKVENDKLNKKLAEYTNKFSEEEKIATKHSKKMKQIEANLVKVQEELELYKNNFHLAFFYKVSEIYSTLTNEILVLWNSQIIPVFTSIHQKTTKGSVVGTIGEFGSSIMSTIMGSLKQFWSKFYQNAVAPVSEGVYDVILGKMNLPASTTSLELVGHLKALSQELFSSLKADANDYYTLVRGTSIKTLQKSQKFGHLADEIVDLSFISLILLLTLLVVNPTISIIVGTINFVLRTIVRIIFFWPFLLVRRSVYFVTFGYGTWFRNRSVSPEKKNK